MIKEMTALFKRYENLKSSDRALVAVVIKQCKKVVEDWKVKLQQEVMKKLQQQGLSDLVVNTFLATVDDVWHSHVADDQLEVYLDTVEGDFSEPTDE